MRIPFLTYNLIKIKTSSYKPHLFLKDLGVEAIILTCNFNQI